MRREDGRMGREGRGKRGVDFALLVKIPCQLLMVACYTNLTAGCCCCCWLISCGLRDVIDRNYLEESDQQIAALARADQRLHFGYKLQFISFHYHVISRLEMINCEFAKLRICLCNSNNLINNDDNIYNMFNKKQSLQLWQWWSVSINKIFKNK